MNPNYPTAHHCYSFLLLRQRRTNEALNEIKLAHSLDPRSSIINSALGDVLFFMGEFDQAIEQYQKTVTKTPEKANVGQTVAGPNSHCHGLARAD